MTNDVTATIIEPKSAVLPKSALFNPWVVMFSKSSLTNSPHTIKHTIKLVIYIIVFIQLYDFLSFSGSLFNTFFVNHGFSGASLLLGLRNALMLSSVILF